MSRFVLLLCGLLALVPVTAGAAATAPPPAAPLSATPLPATPLPATPLPAPQSWALPQIKLLVSRGLMGAHDPTSFRPDDLLTRGALENLVYDLTLPATASTATAAPTTTASGTTTGTTATTTTGTTTAATPVSPKVANPGAVVTMAQLDSRLVGALGLSETAAQFARSARASGLTVPSRFGSEVVARLLGLRTNHPASQDELELLPNDPATRAEAAYSAAQILRFGSWQAASLQASAVTFALPTLSTWQKRVLSTAASLVGYPYVWGGESELPESPFGHQARGGFDCSGFVWRVYKLQQYPDEGVLADTLRGRTTFEMSGEVPAKQRIALAKLQPADVIFFGAQGAKSKPAQVDHMGIYLGNGWFIHSSDRGVAIAQLSGWYQTRFAWGRRPLDEAALPHS
jgi:cell wall-associated NlpC family hydrolase